MSDCFDFQYLESIKLNDRYVSFRAINLSYLERWAGICGEIIILLLEIIGLIVV